MKIILDIANYVSYSNIIKTTQNNLTTTKNLIEQQQEEVDQQQFDVIKYQLFNLYQITNSIFFPISLIKKFHLDSTNKLITLYFLD